MKLLLTLILAMLAAAAGLTIAAVYLLAGPPWAMIAAAVCLVAGALWLRAGLLDD